MYNSFIKQKENQMVSVEKLIELGVLRESFFGNGDWYVIYTENGAKDISLSELTE